jgi:hypothetical protein
MVGHPQANTSSQTEQAVLYIAWNLWKERCRRVFDNKEVGGVAASNFHQGRHDELALGASILGGVALGCV